MDLQPRLPRQNQGRRKAQPTMKPETLDFRVLFEGSPDILLVLLPDAPRYTMGAATEARLAATHTTREQTLGRGLFELFPDNPDDPDAAPPPSVPQRDDDPKNDTVPDDGAGEAPAGTPTTDTED